MDKLLNWRGGIINNRFCAQRTHKVDISRRGGADNMRPFPSGKLDREQANATSCTLNQDTLTSLQSPMIKDTLPGSRCPCRYCSSLIKTQRLGLRRKLFYRSRGIFCVCSLWTQAKNCLPFLKRCHAGTNLLHDTSQIKARCIRKLHWKKVFR